MRSRRPGVIRRSLTIIMTVTLMLALAVPQAHAHAELRQSSPEADETVGGDIHSISLQFFDLDVTKPQDARVFDEAGNQLEAQTNREDQRLVIALVDPIATAGEYTVTFAVNGLDGDFSEESFSFTWEEGAPEPKGITIGLTDNVGFDTLSFVLLLISAAITAFLAQRFLTALKEHRAAQKMAEAG